MKRTHFRTFSSCFRCLLLCYIDIHIRGNRIILAMSHMHMDQFQKQEGQYLPFSAGFHQGLLKLSTVRVHLPIDSIRIDLK